VLAAGLLERSASASPKVLEGVLEDMKTASLTGNMKLCTIATRRLNVYMTLDGQLTLAQCADAVNMLFSLLKKEESSLFSNTKVLRALGTLLSEKRAGLGRLLKFGWKDLYDLIEFFHIRKERAYNLGSSSIRASHAERLRAVCVAARKFYGPESVVPVCEFAELFMGDSLSRDLFHGQMILTLFLPSVEGGEYEPYFSKWIYTYWDQISNCAEWDGGWLRIITRALKWGHQLLPNLVHADPGVIQVLFRRIQSALSLASPTGLNLPRRTTRLASLTDFATKGNGIEYAPKLAVQLIGHGSAVDFFALKPEELSQLTFSSKSAVELEACVQNAPHGVSCGMLHLQRLLLSIDTLFHPHNEGSHTSNVARFLEALTTSFSKRVGRACVEGSTIEPFSDADKEVFVESVLSLATMGMYFRGRLMVHCAQPCIGNLAYLSPHRVANKFIPLIFEGLDPMNLTQTHQAPAAMKMLTVLVQPLTQTRCTLFTEALPEVLLLTLPGLDPNDMVKTMSTFMLYHVVLSWIPIIDVETEGLGYPDTSPEALKSYGFDDPEVERAAAQGGDRCKDAMWRGNAVLVEWGLCCLDQLFAYIDNLVKSATGGVQEQLDNALHTSLVIVARLLFSQMSPSVRQQAGKKTNIWALNSCNVDALSESKNLIAAYVQGIVALDDSHTMKEVVIKGLFEPMLDLIRDPDTSVRRLKWSLSIVGAIARGSGEYIIPYRAAISATIDLALAHEDSEVQTLGGQLLRRTIRGLSESDCTNYASTNATSPLDYAKLAVSWAASETWRETSKNIRWNVPTEQSLSEAQHWKTMYLNKFLECIDKKIQDNDTTSKGFRNDLKCLLQVVRGSVSMMTTLNERRDLIVRFCGILDWTLQHRESDATSQGSLISILDTLVICFGSQTKNRSKLTGRHIWLRYMREVMVSGAYVAEKNWRCKFDKIKDMEDVLCPRYHHIEETRLLNLAQRHELAYEMTREAKAVSDEAYMHVLFNTLMEANKHDWVATREATQKCARNLITRAPWFGKPKVELTLIPRLGEKEDFATIAGAVSLMRWNKVFRWVSTDWNLLDAFYRTVVFNSSVDGFPEHKQKNVSEGVQRLIVSMLNAWSIIPCDEKETEIRLALVKDLIMVKDQSWRQELVISTLLGTLFRAGDRNVEVVQWILQRTKSDIQPLRTVALSAFVQMLAKATIEERTFLVNALELSNDKLFFKSLAETMSQNHTQADSTNNLRQRSNWSAGVSETLRLSRFPGSKFYPETCVPSHSKMFKTSHKLMVQFLSEAIGTDNCVETIVELINGLLSEDTDHAEHKSRVCAAVEIFSGFAAVHGYTQNMVEVLNGTFLEVSLESADMWLDAFRLCGKDTLCFLNDYTDKLSVMMNDRGESAPYVVQANLFRLVRTLIYEVKPTNEAEVERFRGICISVLQLIVNNAPHTYEVVRKELARTFVTLQDINVRRENLNLPISESIQRLLKQCDESVRSKETSDTTRAIETVIFLAASLVLTNGLAMESSILEFFPLVISSQKHPHIEISKKAQLAASCLASITFSSHEKSLEAIALLSELSSQFEDNWSSRSTIVQLFGSLVTLNFPLMGYAVAGIHARKEIEQFLRDGQVEVQNASCAILMRLLNSYSKTSPSLTTTRDRYLKLAATKVLRSEYKTEDGKNKLKKRLTGVLGMTAVVNAFPYSIPFPGTVVALAKRTGDPGLVGQSAKYAIADFRRTQADSWEKNKHVFTSNELDDLQDVSYSGSHT